jgi:uncharacterized membrane protein
VAEQTESSIAIAAPADEVMAVIADLEAYPDWNDEVKQIEVLSVYDDEDERPAEVRFVLDAGAIKDDYTLEYTWEGDESVRGRSSARRRCSSRWTARTTSSTTATARRS